MWKKIVSTVFDFVSWAERELIGKNGAEKRQMVIEQLAKGIDIPFVPDLVETPIERIVYGYLIDRACAWFNVLGDGDFAELVLTDEQKEKLVALVEADPQEMPAGVSGVEEKLNAFYSKYAGE